MKFRFACKTTRLTADASDDAYNMMAEIWITVAGNGLETATKRETDQRLADQIRRQATMLLSMLCNL